MLFTAHEAPALGTFSRVTKKIAPHRRAHLYAEGDPAFSGYGVVQGVVLLYASDEDGVEVGLGLVGEGETFGDEVLDTVRERKTYADALGTARYETLQAQGNDRDRLMVDARKRAQRIAKLLSTRRAQERVRCVLEWYGHMPVPAGVLALLAQTSRESFGRFRRDLRAK